MTDSVEDFVTVRSGDVFVRMGPAPKRYVYAQVKNRRMSLFLLYRTCEEELWKGRIQLELVVRANVDGTEVWADTEGRRYGKSTMVRGLSPALKLVKGTPHVWEAVRAAARATFIGEQLPGYRRALHARGYVSQLDALERSVAVLEFGFPYLVEQALFADASSSSLAPESYRQVLPELGLPDAAQV